MQVYSTSDLGLYLECMFGPRYDEHVRAKTRADWLRAARASNERSMAEVWARLAKMREGRRV